MLTARDKDELAAAIGRRKRPVTAVSPVEQLLRQVLAEQARQGENLDAILRLLERGRGARDGADAALLERVAESIGERVSEISCVGHSMRRAYAPQTEVVDP